MAREVTLQELVEGLNEARLRLGLDRIGAPTLGERERLEDVALEQQIQAIREAVVPRKSHHKLVPSKAVQAGLDAAKGIEDERALYRQVEIERAMAVAADLNTPPRKLINNPALPVEIAVAVDEGVCPCGCGSRDPRTIAFHVARKAEAEQAHSRVKPSRAVLLDQHMQRECEAERRRADRLAELLALAVPYRDAVEQAAVEFPPPALPAELQEPEQSVSSGAVVTDAQPVVVPEPTAVQPSAVVPAVVSEMPLT